MSKYLGRRFELNGNTFELWRYQEASTPGGQGSYTAVRVLDPSKPIETVPYTVTRKVGKTKSVVRGNFLRNVDSNSYFNVPANEAFRSVEMPETQILKKPKKVLPTPARFKETANESK